jgi:hypothetical protein
MGLQAKLIKHFGEMNLSSMQHDVFLHICTWLPFVNNKRTSFKVLLLLKHQVPQSLLQSHKDELNNSKAITSKCFSYWQSSLQKIFHANNGPNYSSDFQKTRVSPNC